MRKYNDALTVGFVWLLYSIEIPQVDATSARNFLQSFFEHALAAW